MSIRAKLTIAFLAVALIPALLIGTSTFTKYEKYLKVDRLSDLQNITVFKADKIEKYFAELKANIEMAQSFYNIKKNLPVLTRFVNDQNNPELLASKKMLDGQLQHMQSILGLTNIMLVNPQGKIVYESNSNQVSGNFQNSLSYPEQKAFIEGKDKIYFSDIFSRGVENNQFAMLVTAPISDFNDTFIGVIAFDVDMAPIYKIIQDVTGLGESGETLIGKKIGNQAVFLNPLRHDPQATLKRKITFGGKVGLPIQEAVQGKNGYGNFVDYRGKQVVSAWRYLPSLGWGMVAKIDKEEAFAEITYLKKLVTIILAIILLLTGAVAVAIARSISDPIKKLVKGTEIIGSGNLDYQVGTALKDEVGQLSRAFDKMTKDLKKITASKDELDKEIAARKRFEQILQENEERFRMAVDHYPGTFVIYDVQHRVKFMNEYGLNIRGVSQDKVIGFRAEELSPPEITQALMPVLKKTFETKTTHTAECTMKLRTGIVTFIVTYAPSLNEDGSIRQVIGVTHDITERKMAEEALRQMRDELEIRVDLRTRQLRASNEILEKIFSNTHFSIVFLDSQFNFIRVNQAYAQACGYPVDFFPGKNHFDLYPDKENQSIFEEVVRTGKSFSVYSKPFKFPDHPEWGVTYWDWSLLPVKGPGGKVDGIVFCLADVTQRKKAEEELLKTQRQLDEAKRLSDIGTLAATVAHELRNPLAAINMAAFNMHRKAGNPLLTGHFEVIERKIKESEQIISNLLFYSRIKPPKHEKIKISEIIEECVTQAEERFQKERTIVKQMDRIKDILIDADPLQLKEVFSNILNNAYQAMLNRPGQITVLGDIHEPWIKIEVKDEGAGIEEEDLKRIFDPFFTTKAQGTGLGLTVCTQIVALHNGTVDIKSKVGQGTTVIINLPIKRENRA